MKKIPTMFVRNPKNMRELLDEPHPDCAWVFRGEGTATRKYDGTAVKIDLDFTYWKRREVKRGREAPRGFDEVQVDETTGKRVGWVPVDLHDPADRYHCEGIANLVIRAAGTYELCGPKVQGNPEDFASCVLVAHWLAEMLDDVPRTLDGLRTYLAGVDIEGIVFHHPDGRMAKIKKRDFGLLRRRIA